MDNGAPRWISLGITIVLCGIGAYGLPYHSLVTLCQWDLRDNRPVDFLIETSLNANDVVYADWSAFYAVRKARVEAYFPTYFGYADRSTEIRKITVAIIRPEEVASVLKLLGGHWEIQPKSLRPMEATGNRILAAMRHRFEAKYELSVYRRQ